MFYILTICSPKPIFCPFRCQYSFLCVVAVALSEECKITLAISGEFRDTDSSWAPDTTSDFYGPMIVHRGALVTVNLCFFVFYTWMLYMEQLRYYIRDTLHKKLGNTQHILAEIDFYP